MILVHEKSYPDGDVFGLRIINVDCIVRAWTDEVDKDATGILMSDGEIIYAKGRISQIYIDILEASRK